jgi:hypothetical protein
MAQDIKQYRTILENAYNEDADHHDLNDPATVAELVKHVFSSGVDKETLKHALLGHKNDPQWALNVLNHLNP